jgi:hypothetical protein
MNKLKSYVLFGAFLLVVGVSDFSAYGDDNYPASDRHEMDVEDNSCDYMQILTSGKTWNWIILYENGHFEPGYAEVADNVEIAGYSCKRVSSILGEEAFSPIRKSYILREDGPKLYLYDEEHSDFVLLMDFDLPACTELHDGLRISSKDECTVNGITRRRFRIEDETGNWVSSWVEGIGALDINHFINRITSESNNWRKGYMNNCRDNGVPIFSVNDFMRESAFQSLSVRDVRYDYSLKQDEVTEKWYAEGSLEFLVDMPIYVERLMALRSDSNNLLKESIGLEHSGAENTYIFSSEGINDKDFFSLMWETESGDWRIDSSNIIRVRDYMSDEDKKMIIDNSGITDIQATQCNNFGTYDVLGRRVSSTVPGSVYIRGGKKFVAK